MEIKYERSLPHQQKAVDAISKVFEGVAIGKPEQLYANPLVDLQDTKLKDNIKTIQNNDDYNVDIEHRIQTIGNKSLNLDIKMETGTGKTYVYTHTIYELHKRYGINKFIVAVPTLSIKEGAKSFLGDADVKRHFSNTCGYNADIDLCVLIAKQKKKGKNYFPSEVREFVNGSHHNTNKIYVLLVNMGLLSDRKDGMLVRNDYDQTLQGFYQPYNAIKATHPFVIIDEPHRFSRNQKAHKVICDELNPQCIIRFGATFPKITNVKGRNKITNKDYENLLYNLNACQAFNQNLVKGVEKEHFGSPDKRNEKIKVLRINSKKSVVLGHIQSNGKKLSNTSHTLSTNDSLGSITQEMSGMNITAIGKDFVEFSNGTQKKEGEEFDVSVLSSSYQEAMMKLALDRHFETERENFNRSQRIKTLALFFIDNIQSFRGDENGQNAWLRDKFNQLLKEKLDAEISRTTSVEYKSFLQASLVHLNDCSAGYFSQDNSDSDESIAKEVDDILRNKKEMLSFKDKDGNWNVRRFLFSKWTLKEGWDNPNVFTITKLRSSGSENSKIQEVGRGLRLPVDEYGNRLNEEFWLNYIVDFTEADFADKLIAEINGELTNANLIVISDQELERVAVLRKITSDELFDELKRKKYIDRHQVINQTTLLDFYNDYPEFKPIVGVNSTKVRNRNKQTTPMVKIRSKKYDELKDLWENINQKYIIYFNNDLNSRIEKDFHFGKNTFEYVVVSSNRTKVDVSEKGAEAETESGVQYEMRGRRMPYNELLKRINKATSMPIQLLHNKVMEYFKKNPTFNDSYINESSMTNIINQFNDWKVENVKGLLNYQRANYNSKETSLTDVNGDLREEIAQGLVGVSLEKGTPSDKYLYEGIAYDSELEKLNIKTDVDDVIVFGKIPRRSIAIPTILGNYSPDFMYVVTKKDGNKELNIVIETKGVEGKNQLRPVEQIKIDCAQKFFEQLQIDGYDVKFRNQLNNAEMKKIIEALFKEEELKQI